MAWEHAGAAGDVDAKYSLGLLALEERRFADADRWMAEVVEHGGQRSYAAALHRGQALERGGRPHEAEPVYRVAPPCSSARSSPALPSSRAARGVSTD